MNDDLVQIFARLTVHEFALEVLMANFVAALPEQVGEDFLIDFRRKMRSAYTNNQEVAGHPDIDQVISDSIQLADHLIDKVERRVASIRQIAASI